MIRQLTNHLWQSTLFAVVVGLLTVAFRKNRARIRYWLWFSMTLKFLLPFSLLMVLGSRLDWAPLVQSAAPIVAPSVSLAMVQITQPFPDPLPQASPVKVPDKWAAMAIPGVWALGFAGIAWIRFRGWHRIRGALRRSTPSDIPAAVEVRFSPVLLEPGVVGLVRPILLLPAGIEDHLTPPQLAAVLAHELCHVRRRDNLLASIHMLVEAVFWFHPLVWWIGAHLLEERERACDEEVLRLGNQPLVYAEGIVKVCKIYLESPLVCVSGVTGSNLTKRIEAIMKNRIALRLNFPRKAVLTGAGIFTLAVPIVIGIMDTPRMRAQSAPAGTPKFETVSIQPGCATPVPPAGNAPMVPNRPGSPASLNFECVTVANIIRQAYGRFSSGRPLPEASPLVYVDAIPITGGPAWIYTDHYQVQAKAPGDPGGEMILGPMMQALLEDRFKVKVRRETREVPAYALAVADGGPKMRLYLGDCISRSVLPPLPAGQKYCSQIGGGDSKEPNFSPHFAPESGVQDLDEFSLWLFIMTDRPVFNRTGIPGRFFMQFSFAPDQATPGALNRLAIVARRNGADAGRALAPSSPAGPSIFTALQQQLGLQLEPITAARDFIVVDHAERPTAN